MTMRPLAMGCLVAAVTIMPASASAETIEGGNDVTSAEEVSPILIGTTVPDGSLKTQHGRETTLREVLGDSPTVLVFYRGHW